MLHETDRRSIRNFTNGLVGFIRPIGVLLLEMRPVARGIDFQCLHEGRQK